MNMRSSEEIADLYRRRVREQAQVHARMRELSRVYDDKTVLPLPELNQSERPAIPNLAQQGLDQHAMRIASVVPDVKSPSQRPGYKGHDDRASLRQQAIGGWYEKSKMSLLLRKRARHLLGFSATPIVIKPDPEYRIPRWHVRNPMGTWPSEWGEADDLSPTNCIFDSQKSAAWISDRWPDAFQRLYKGDEWQMTDEFTVLEYYDSEQMTMIALGRTPETISSYDHSPAVETGQVVTLEDVPNRIGRCPVVMPKRINLNGPKGQFDGILGMYQTEAMLMALSVQATFKGIFQETWVVDAPNERADVEEVPNPLTGQPGIIHGGQIQKFGVDPQFQTNQAMDRLEYGQRSTASIPAEYGGYGGTNVRTGKRGAQVMGAAVDYPIQEHQEILALSMEEENRVAIACDRSYFGDETKSYYVSWGKNRGLLTYKPDDIFDTDETKVTYAYAGADENALSILVGQRIGMGTLSKESAMEIDPMIPDVEHEQDRITSEALGAAFLSKVQTDAANPESPMSGGDVAKLRRLILTDRMDIEEAWDEVQKAIQERQAEAMKAQEEAMMGQQPGPGQMPGLEGEGMASIPPSQESMPGARNLGNLLGDLRKPQMQMGSERQGGVREGAPT